MSIVNVIVELEKSVSQFPKKTAIYGINRNFTYEQVQFITSFFAAYLEKNVGNNENIGLFLEHSENIIISFFSILKSHNTYVPFSTKTNFSRFKENIEDLNINYLITDSHNYLAVQEKFKDKYVINIDEYLDIRKIPSFPNNKCRVDRKNQDIIYIMHTSGSTGKPKGVKVNANNLNYITDAMQRITPCDEKSTILFITPYTFDVSITEICGWVYSGASVVCRDLNLDTWYEDIRKVLQKYNITHISACPSVFATMINIYSKENNIFSNLKFVVLAGERFIVNIHKIWKERDWSFRLFNAYGPTETTVYCTLYELSKDIEYEEVPIGTPFPGVKYFIDENSSELLVSGNGITNGYIDNAITSKYFINIDDEIYYKTGDIVEFKSGLLYFKGRNDNQIKVNGIRVELGEIENRIEEILYVKQTKVIYHNNKIIAFIKTDFFDEEYFRNYFNKNLEKYLIPNKFYLVSEFPLNQSKKVDKDKLISIFLNDEVFNGELNEFEYEIKNLFEKVIKIDKANITKKSNFFDLGGDSLSSVLLSIGVEEKYGISLTISDIYNYPTIEQLSLYISSLKSAENTSISLNNKKNTVKKDNDIEIEMERVKDYICRVGHFFTMYETLHLQRVYYYDNFESYIEFEYIFSKGESLELIISIINNLISNVPMLRTNFFFEDNKLYFTEKIMENLVNVPLFDVTYQSNEYISNIKLKIKEILMNYRKKEGLLNSLILLKNGNQYTLVGIMDHSIADASTPATIFEIISNFINNKKTTFETTYKDYIRLINDKNNMKEIISNSFYQELVKCGENQKFDIKNMKNGFNVYKANLYSDEKQLSNLQINLFLSYKIGHYLLKISNQNSVVIKFLANGKDFLDEKYKYVIGDFHTSIYIIVYKGEKYSDYQKRVMESISLNYGEKVFRPAYVYGRNYPYKNEEQKKLKNSLRHTKYTSIDFLGRIKEKEYDEYTISVKKSLDQLTQIDDTLYVTVYLVNNQLVIYTNKELLDFETYIN